jgi:CheY-like chemotaxis protein
MESDILYFRNSISYLRLGNDDRTAKYMQSRRAAHSSLVFAAFLAVLTVYWVTTSVYGTYCGEDKLLFASCILSIVGVLVPGWILLVHRCSYSEKQEKINIVQYVILRTYSYIEGTFAVCGSLAFGLNLLFCLSLAKDEFMTDDFHHCSKVAANKNWVVCATLQSVGICTILYPYFAFCFTKSLRWEVSLVSWATSLIFIILVMTGDGRNNHNSSDGVDDVMGPVYIVLHVLLGFSMFERERNDYFYFSHVNRETAMIVPEPVSPMMTQHLLQPTLENTSSTSVKTSYGPTSKRPRDANNDNNGGSVSSSVTGENKNKVHAVVNLACEELLSPLLASEMGFETLESLLPKLLSQDFVALAMAKLKSLSTSGPNPGQSANLAAAPSTTSSSPRANSTVSPSGGGVGSANSTDSASGVGDNAVVSINKEPRTNGIVPQINANLGSRTLLPPTTASPEMSAHKERDMGTSSFTSTMTAQTVVGNNNDEVLSPVVVATLKSINSLMASQRGFCMELLQGMKASAHFTQVVIANLRDTSASLAKVPLQPCYETFNMAESINCVVNAVSETQPSVRIAANPSPDVCSCVFSDKKWFEHNLYSLIANAVQISLHHSFDEFPVELNVSLQDRIKGQKHVEMIVVEMYDSGSNLTSEFLNDAFSLSSFDKYGPEAENNEKNIFLQQQSPRSLFNLYALRKRVNALGGLYGAKKRPDAPQGSIFWFATPYYSSNPTRMLNSGRGPAAKSTSNNNNNTSRRGLNESSNHESLMNELIGDHSVHAHDDEAAATAAVEVSAVEDDEFSQSVDRRSVVMSTSGLKGSHHLGKLSSRTSWLIADDSIAILKVMAISLRRLGHTVDTAQNGGVALAMMMEREYDVVLIDINMPVLDGLETVTLYRQQEANTLRLIWPYPSQEVSRNRRQLILGMSADSNCDITKKRALACGVDAFVSKPISVDQLVKTVVEVKSALARPSASKPASMITSTATVTASGASVSVRTANSLLRGAAASESRDDGM